MNTLDFKGSGSEYFKIWIVNILLTIVTFGLYYPWAKVRNNRYFYANSTLDENFFEYHATGKQLFVGYFISIILFATYVILNKIIPQASLFLILGLFIIIPWIIWRSMRFNMNVTSFSNVKFNFDGKLSQSYVIFLAYPIALFISIAILIGILSSIHNVVVTIVGIFLIIALGVFAFAYFNNKQTSYLINSSSFGQSRFKTNLQTNAFVKILLKTYSLGFLITIIGMVAFAGLFFLSINNPEMLFSSIMQNGRESKALEEAIMASLYFVVPFYFLSICPGFVVLSYYIARKREYIFGNTILDEDIKFSSNIKFLNLAFVIVSNLAITIITLGLAIPWAKVRMANYMLNNTQISSNSDLKTFISQKESRESAIGEEIGDTFDVDVGLAL